MKYVIVLFMLLPLHLIGQNGFGIYVGYSDASQKYEDWVLIPDGADTSIDALNAGFFFDHWVSNRFYLESRLGFAKRGAACEPGFFLDPIDTNFRGDTDLEINYAETSLRMNYRSKITRLINLDFGLGYGVSSAFSARTINPAANPPVVIQNIGQDERISRIDHGLHSSLKLGFNFQRVSLFSSVESYHGFKDADSSNTSKNRVISLNFGVSMNF